MDKATAIERFQRQIAEIDTIPKQKRFSPEFKKWRRDTEILIEKVFGEDSRHISDAPAKDIVTLYDGFHVSAKVQ